MIQFGDVCCLGMNIRKSLRAVSAVWIICCVSMAKADDQGVISSSWETDFTAAKQIAERDSKDLFLNFTGSDWCGFCIALRDKVLTNSAFEQGASEHFVFVELDYPRHKDQSENLRKQNDELRRTFGVKGFPTLMLADAQGRPFAQLSNQPGIEPEQLASQMRSLQGLREKRDVFLSEAESLEGMKRAEKLDEALDLLDDELVERFYGDFTDEIISLDEKGTLKRKKDRFCKGLKRA